MREHVVHCFTTCRKHNHTDRLQNCKNKTAVKLTAVSCPPVVEVKIKRPDTKYQLGFSVQNGVVSVSFLSCTVFSST